MSAGLLMVAFESSSLLLPSGGQPLTYS